MTTTSKLKVKNPMHKGPDVAPVQARRAHLEQLVQEWQRVEKMIQQGGVSRKSRNSISREN
jgi:multidrug resistance efflux pump